MLTSRDTRAVVGRQLFAPFLNGGRNALGPRLIAGRFTDRPLNLIMQHNEVARAHLDLLLDSIHLSLQCVVAMHCLHASVCTQNGVEQNDCSKPATDAIEERECEDFYRAASS